MSEGKMPERVWVWFNAYGDTIAERGAPCKFNDSTPYVPESLLAEAVELLGHWTTHDPEDGHACLIGTRAEAFLTKIKGTEGKAR